MRTFILKNKADVQQEVSFTTNPSTELDFKGVDGSVTIQSPSLEFIHTRQPTDYPEQNGPVSEVLRFNLGGQYTVELNGDVIPYRFKPLQLEKYFKGNNSHQIIFQLIAQDELEVSYRIVNRSRTPDCIIRIYQLIKDCPITIDTTSPFVKYMDLVEASVGLSLSPSLECEGLVNRAGGLVMKVDEQELMDKFIKQGLKVDLLEQWQEPAVSCIGTYNLLDGLYIDSEAQLTVLVNNEVIADKIQFNGRDFETVSLQRKLLEKGLLLETRIEE